MRIEIDTTKDSEEDIQSAVQLLQSLGGHVLASNEPSEESANAFSSMFAQSNTASQGEVPKEKSVETY